LVTIERPSRVAGRASRVTGQGSRARVPGCGLRLAGTGRLQIYTRDASAECDGCWQELENAAADYKPNRALNFYVDPAKGHDDYLMSLALTVEAASGYEPRAAVGRVG